MAFVERVISSGSDNAASFALYKMGGVRGVCVCGGGGGGGGAKMEPV